MNAKEENLIKGRRPVSQTRKTLRRRQRGRFEGYLIGENIEIAKYLEAEVILQKKQEICVYGFLSLERRIIFSCV